MPSGRKRSSATNSGGPAGRSEDRWLSSKTRGRDAARWGTTSNRVAAQGGAASGRASALSQPLLLPCCARCARWAHALGGSQAWTLRQVSLSGLNQEPLGCRGDGEVAGMGGKQCEAVSKVAIEVTNLCVAAA